MSEEREKLQQARALIEQKQYQAARELLQTMATHPTAHKWLVQVEQAIARQHAPPPSEEDVQSRLREASDLVKAKDYEAARAVLSPVEAHPTAQEWIAKLDRRLGAQRDVENSHPAAAREALLAAGNADPLDDLEMHPALRTVARMLRTAGIDVRLAAVAVGLALVSGILAALLDAILGIPGPLLEIALSWIVAALNGPAYAVMRGKIDRGGLLMSAAAGLMAMFGWFVVATVITGDPSVTDGNFSARDTYAYWFNEYVNILKAWWTGILIGLLSFGWYALLPQMPQLGERVLAFSGKFMNSLGERIENEE